MQCSLKACKTAEVQVQRILKCTLGRSPRGYFLSGVGRFNAVIGELSPGTAQVKLGPARQIQICEYRIFHPSS